MDLLSDVPSESVKLEILKILISSVINNSDITNLLEDEIEKVKKENGEDLDMGDDDFSDSFHEPSGSSGGDVIDFGDDINIDTGANNTPEADFDLGAEEPAAEPAADMLGELPSPENLGVDFTQNTEF